jgi:hypothetical protein
MWLTEHPQPLVNSSTRPVKDEEGAACGMPSAVAGDAAGNVPEAIAPPPGATPGSAKGDCVDCHRVDTLVS